MAAHEGSERYFRETADRITDGAEDQLVARLTSEALDMVERAVANPDRYQVLARLAPQALMGVLAEHGPRMEAAVTDAVLEALRREDAALQAVLATQKAGAAASTTEYAQIYAAQAAKGVTEILQRQNVALADNLARLWYRVTGDAVTRAILGDSKRDIMEDAVRALSDGGLETVDYRSRRRTSIDAATRRHIVTQANQARNRLLTQRCSQYGCDLVFTSAHYGARPDHTVWQGKAYGLHGPVTVDGVRYPGLAASTGYGTVTGLAGANCRHTMTPYVPGLSKLPRTDFSAEERLHGMTSDEYYGATQVQRRLEREVRRCKRRVALGQERGLDMAADRAALGRAQGRVRQWCKQNNLPRQLERERAYGVAKQPRALGRAAREQEPLVPRNRFGAVRDPRFEVDRKAVNGKGYHDRFERLDLPKPARESAYRQAGRILADRDGTGTERMAFIDARTGELVADTFGQRPTAGWCALGPGGTAALATHAGQVVGIHNHAMSSAPSLGDMVALYRRRGKQEMSIIAGHDGSVWTLRVFDMGFLDVFNQNELLWKKAGADDHLAYEKAFDAMVQENQKRKWFELEKK